MTKSAAIVYKPLGLGASVTGGVLAGVIFKQVWKRVGGDQDAPSATDRDRGWGEIVIAAALQGAIFAVVKAVIDRGGAEGFNRLYGEWPGKETTK